jgi:hypothetical protein
MNHCVGKQAVSEQIFPSGTTFYYWGKSMIKVEIRKFLQFSHNPPGLRAKIEKPGLSIYLPIYLSIAAQPFAGPWRLFQFLDLFEHSVVLVG